MTCPDCTADKHANCNEDMRRRTDHMACDQEMCPNWSGDGNVCPCALFDVERCDHDWLDRPESDTRECLICGEEASG